jgi:hypothetical protein
VLLPHQRFKAFGTIFSGENLIRHPAILPYLVNNTASKKSCSALSPANMHQTHSAKAGFCDISSASGRFFFVYTGLDSKHKRVLYFQPLIQEPA